MGKIFRYELRRLLWNKMFFCILAVLLAYGWLTLTGSVIQGVAHTAPFSPWSFGYYLSRLLPILCLGELFFVSFFTSRQERRVAALTGATPVDRRRYALARGGAVFVGTLLLCLSVAGLAAVFCRVLFPGAALASWLLPGLLALLPPLALCLGLGWALGRIHPPLVYGVMLLPFLLAALPLPQALDFSMGAFFAAFPLTLTTLDPAFSAPAAIVGGRLAYLLAGILAPLCLRRGDGAPAGG